MKRSTSSATIRQPAAQESSLWLDSWKTEPIAQDAASPEDDQPDPEYVRMVLYPWQLAKRVK